MQLMLDTEMGAGRNRGETQEAGRSIKTPSWCAFGVRLSLAVFAVGAAWFLMTDAWPAEIAGKALANLTVETGSAPGAIGTLIASLP
jgi:hypothetical protein